MKSRLIVGMGLALALSALTPGLASATGTTGPDPSMLGSVEAVSPLCARINASHTGAYEGLRVKKCRTVNPPLDDARFTKPK